MGNSFNDFLTKAVTSFIVIGVAMFLWGTIRSPFANSWLKNLGHKSVGAVGAYQGKTLYKGWSEDSNAVPKTPYHNDYVPQDSVVDNELEEAAGSAVGSVNFIDKKKNAKKNNKKKKADALAAQSSSSGRKMGLSGSNTTSGGGWGYGGGGYGAMNTANNNNPKKEQEENLDTVEYWDVPIFQNQDPTAVTKLIDSYQIQKVSNGVFYEVVGDMTQDQRPLIRDFAVTALKSTPSAKSFGYLAVMKNVDMDTDIRIEADREVTNYSSLNRLGFAVSSINATGDSSERVAVEAMRAVSKSTETYGASLQAMSHSSDRSTASTAVNLQSKWTQAYGILTEVSQTSSDATVKAEAQKTMDAISKVISI